MPGSAASPVLLQEAQPLVTAQLFPSQCSMRLRVVAVLDWSPTAQQSEAVMQEIPFSSESIPEGAGVVTGCHCEPSQRSLDATPPAPEPTPRQPRAAVQDTASSVAFSPAPARVHVEPFQLTATSSPMARHSVVVRQERPGSEVSRSSDAGLWTVRQTWPFQCPMI